jgi:hypothetical protein
MRCGSHRLPGGSLTQQPSAPRTGGSGALGDAAWRLSQAPRLVRRWGYVTASPTPRRWNAFDRFLAPAALAGGSVIALRAPGLGDYPTDAGPALSAIAHGAIGSFFSHQPAMGAVSLYVRAPFVVLAAALHDSPVGMYRWGDLPCVLSVALIAIWMARVAGRRGMGRLGMGRLGRTVLVAVCLLNPLVNNALYYGHPEELLTASLAVGALLAACERRIVVSAVLTGLAVASKQWALLIVCPTLLVLERERIRAGLIMLAAAAGSTVPMMVGNFAAFRHATSYISTPQPITTIFTWLYPFSATGRVQVTNIFGDDRFFIGHTVAGVVGPISHPLIIGLGVFVPLLVWSRQGWHLSAQAMLLSTGLVFVLRCTLDPGAGAYYYFPLLLTLVALDVITSRKLPIAGLAGAAGAFTVLDRFPDYLGTQAANLLFVAATVAAAALLVRALRHRVPAPAARRPHPSRPRSTRVTKQTA